MYVRTTIVLDDKLIKQVMRLARAKTMREAVDVALRDYVTRARQRDTLGLIGKPLLHDDKDFEAIASVEHRLVLTRG